MLQVTEDIIAAIEMFQDQIGRSAKSTEHRHSKLYQLYTLTIHEATTHTKVQFTSLFARLSYVISTFQIPYKESYLLHSFRKSKEYSNKSDQFLELGNTCIDILLAYCFEHSKDLSIVTTLYGSISGSRRQSNVIFQREQRVLLQSIDTPSKHISGQLMDEPFDQVVISFDRADRNEDYTEIINGIQNYMLPLEANLVDSEIDEDKIYYPSSMVLEPDYLYDVTAIAECFGAFANHQTGYLLRRFSKKASGKAIIIGNTANYFLDQLIYQPDGQFDDFLKKIFYLDPMGISLLSDQEVREMVVLLQSHFDHIKSVVTDQLSQVNVQKEQCQIEPAFYSAKYGIQGRLDLFALSDEQAVIIELKSGSAFRPNGYGLSNNHYHQTLLYDMIIESVYGLKRKRSNFILYSKSKDNQLRYAPALKSEQREAIKERNQLLLHDKRLLHQDDFIQYYFDYAKRQQKNIKGFQKRDFDEFIKVFKELDAAERDYCNTMFQFTLHEQLIGKIGKEGSDKSLGLASLWRESIENKKEQFNIINHLTVTTNASDSDDPHIVFNRSEQTAELSNFRIGDIAILYPHQDTPQPALHHQVYKVTIIQMEEQQVVARLRSRQENEDIFAAHQYWHLEHDHLDNGYTEMTRSIFQFAAASERFRKLIMGRSKPESYAVEQVSCSHHMTEIQSQIFSEIINSKDYYLLWGPPGTGKTSVMLREMAHHYIQHEQDRVLLIAYTNRAVDEICEALLSIEPTPSFIRIGSRYSTHPKFHDRLLENQISNISNRKVLRDKLANEKVYVGTLASIVGKVSLFELVTFEVAIVDEASQILEPSLIGLLSRVQKFILIGDHQQLPAVVQQNELSSEIESPILHDLGFQNLNASLFERLYLRAEREGWEHAIGQLSQQGRMHYDIMQFVNAHYYQETLSCIPSINRLTSLTLSDWRVQRFKYINTEVDLDGDSIKINRHEAQAVVDYCKELISILIDLDYDIMPASIGVITPYRAQIAAIKKEMQAWDPTIANLITVDTVERYQGGARDFIIMSCCMNYSFQLKSLVSTSQEGVDRKLNVAITRAKEQFVLIGNQNVLEQDIGYKNLINYIHEYTA